MKTVLALALALGAAATSSFAQYNLDWFKLAGGGGTSAGGPYSLTGTVGQSEAGAMTGGSFDLVGGFWSFGAAVPATGTPTLTVTLTATNTVLICWPSPSPGFVLQQNADLRTTNWVAVAQTPTDDGTLKCVTVAPPTGRLFFRLKR